MGIKFITQQQQDKNEWQTKILTLLAKWVSKYGVYTSTPKQYKVND